VYLVHAPRFPEMQCLWPAPKLHSPFVLVRTTCRWRWEWNTGRMARENRSIRWKTCPIITFSPTNPTCAALGLNSDLRRECPATNRLVRPLPVCEKSHTQYDYVMWSSTAMQTWADRTPRQYRTSGRRQEPAGWINDWREKTAESKLHQYQQMSHALRNKPPSFNTYKPAFHRIVYLCASHDSESK
jgi:hypothetical protein